MAWKEKIIQLYPNQWDINMVRTAVEKGLITSEDFYEITGQIYN